MLRVRGPAESVETRCFLNERNSAAWARSSRISSFRRIARSFSVVFVRHRFVTEVWLALQRDTIIAIVLVKLETKSEDLLERNRSVSIAERIA